VQHRATAQRVAARALDAAAGNDDVEPARQKRGLGGIAHTLIIAAFVQSILAAAVCSLLLR
jgi:hypothetical protein